MDHRNKLRYILACALIFLCAITFCACGEDADAPNLEDYFTKEEIESWGKPPGDTEAMNGGYLLYYKGNYYPIEFAEEGNLFWGKFDLYVSRDMFEVIDSPDALFFADLSELYTDKACKNRCAYLGYYIDWGFPSDGWEGYICDGNAPKYGSVLYLDETKERKVTWEGNDYGPDDILPSSVIRMHGTERITNEDGTLMEYVNTPRKIYTYLKESARNKLGNLPWRQDCYTEYTHIWYPSSFTANVSKNETDLKGWSPDVCYEYSLGYIQLNFSEEVEIAMHYDIYLDYQSNFISNEHYALFTSVEKAREFTDQIQKDERYSGIERNEQNLVTRYFDTRSNQEVVVVHSMEEFNQILKDKSVVDTASKKALAYFTKYKSFSEKQFDGHWDYYVKIPDSPWGVSQNFVEREDLFIYAVWEDCRTVQLCTPDNTIEVLVSEHMDALLPTAMYPKHEFVGWYADESCTGQPITTLTYTSGYEKLYGKFREVDHYTLTFEPYDGKTQKNIQYVYGEGFTLPIATKPFHIFKGWYTDPECRTEPITAISTEFYGSYHLYPRFEARKYVITVAVGEQEIQSNIAYGSNYFLPITDVGEGFIGYFDENGVQYTDENGKSLAPFTDGADIQLFAKYKEE